MADFDAYLKLKSQPEAVKWSGFETAPDPMRFKAHFCSLLGNPKQHLFFLKKEGCNDVFGYCQYELVSDDVILAHGLGIDEQYQGQGLSNVMKELEIAEMRKTNAKRVETWVSEKNERSIKMNLRCGFTKAELPPPTEQKFVEMKAQGEQHRFIKMHLIL